MRRILVGVVDLSTLSSPFRKTMVDESTTPSRYTPGPMSTIQKKLQSLLDTVIADGRERGMQLAVYQNGKLIVDAWAGHMDPDKAKPVVADTLFPVFSVTKGIATTAAQMAVEKGLIT